MNASTIPESLVDATRAAELLGIKPRRLMELARMGKLPAYPLGAGARKTWRFRLSEISAAITTKK